MAPAGSRRAGNKTEGLLAPVLQLAAPAAAVAAAAAAAAAAAEAAAAAAAEYGCAAGVRCADASSASCVVGAAAVAAGRGCAGGHPVGVSSVRVSTEEAGEFGVRACGCGVWG